jgi:hypothetical protein
VSYIDKVKWWRLRGDKYSSIQKKVWRRAIHTKRFRVPNLKGRTLVIFLIRHYLQKYIVSKQRIPFTCVKLYILCRCPLAYRLAKIYITIHHAARQTGLHYDTQIYSNAGLVYCLMNICSSSRTYM